jgi:hypothetical protein
MSSTFSFPNPVDEVSARLVAGGVVIMGAVALVTANPLLLAVLAYGFVARVLTGPTLSPLGQVVTRVVRPRLAVAARPVPGPPKRFAQGVGAAFSGTALVLRLVDQTGASRALLGVLVAFAILESVFAFCMGCTVFGWLMQAGVIPESVCAECADIRRRSSAPDDVHARAR